MPEDEEGDPQQEFEELVGPHLDALFGFALRMTRDRDAAEDLLQETLLRAYRGLAGFTRGTHFKAWTFRIMSNSFISTKRRDRRRPSLCDIDAVDEPSEAAVAELEDAETDWDEVYARHVEDDVKQALDDLPDEFRAPLLLSSLGGLSYKEIADALEVPVGTVMSRLFRARQRLRRALRDFARERGILEGGG